MPASGTGSCPGFGRASATATGIAGPYDPAARRALQPHKLLLDPYARAVDGDVKWGDEMLGYVPGQPDVMSQLDSGPSMVRGIVVRRAVRLGDGRTAADPLLRRHHLRDPRQGLQPAPPGRAAGTARHLRGACLACLSGSPDEARRNHSRAAPGPQSPRRRLPASPKSGQLLGLHDPRLLRSAPRATRQRCGRAVRKARSTSSSPWSRPSTRPGSK